MPLTHGICALFDIIDLPPREGVHLAVAIPTSQGERELPAAAQPQAGRLAAGRGLTRAQARASCAGEAAELASAVRWGDEPSIVARRVDLGPRALHPAQLMPVSQGQRRDRDRLRAAGVPIPAPFDDAALLPWVALTDAAGGDPVHAPAACVYLGEGDPADDTAAAWADSTGCAAGPTRETALVAGFLELVERDATALWWYGRHQRPAFDPGPEVRASQLLQRLSARPGHFVLLDLTTDIAIPVCAALSIDAEGGSVGLGVAARFNAADAGVAAMTEMLQVETATAMRLVRPEHDPLADWMRRIAEEDLPFLHPDPVKVAQRNSPTFGATPETCLAVCIAHGLDFLFADLTRDAIGQPVVRVIVPGLRGLEPWFGSGRLFDVPTGLCWPGAPRAEVELNCLPLII